MTTRFSLSLLSGVIIVASMASDPAAGTSLYRCVTETEGTIYTDNPAQLEPCAPITASGAVTSLATVSSGGPPISPQTESLPPTPTVVMPPPGSSPSTLAAAPPSFAPNPLPCPVGINPLNPFTNPPCPAAEASTSATITMPAGAMAQP